MAFFDFLSKNNNNTAQHRKEESIRILKQQGVPFIEHCLYAMRKAKLRPEARRKSLFVLPVRLRR